MIAKFEKYLVKEMDMMRVMKERVAVVIPYYHSDLSDLEKISFHNCLSILGEHPIILVVPEKIPQERYPLKEGVSYEVVPNEWLKSVDTYNEMIAMGAKPQEARSILPNSLKTEIIVTMDLREWRHFFKLRTAERAHPQMREVALMLLEEMKGKMDILFDDI